MLAFGGRADLNLRQIGGTVQARLRDCRFTVRLRDPHFQIVRTELHPSRSKTVGADVEKAQ